MKELWYKFDGLGQLYRQVDLAVGNEPVLFVCVDAYDNKYLVMTYNPYMLEYVFIRVRNTDLVNMLENRITMEQVYRNADIIYLSRDSENEELKVETYNPKSFSSDMLPVAGKYCGLQIDYVNRYVDELKTNIALTLLN